MSKSKKNKGGRNRPALPEPGLYFAYGSNLDVDGMARRCPQAIPVTTAKLHGWRLTFRGCADVEPAEGEVVHGALWDCTSSCIANLDRYEGVRGGFYRKEWLEVETLHGPVEALVYIMNPTPYDNASLPAPFYLDTLVAGFRHFRLPHNALREALEHCRARVDAKGVRGFEPDSKRLRPTDPELVATRRIRPSEKAKAAAKAKVHVQTSLPTPPITEGMSPATIAEIRLMMKELESDEVDGLKLTDLENPDIELPVKGERVA